MFACAVEEGICLLEFTDRKMPETELKSLTKKLNAIILLNDNKHFEISRKQLTEYFESKRKVFRVPLYTPGTAFQKIVRKGLQNIPYGSTRSYKQQAASIANSSASELLQTQMA